MRTIKLLLATLSYFVFASNVEACNQGSQASSTISVVDSSNVGKLTLISPYPNPSSGATSVGFTNSQKVTYSFIVVSIQGDTIYTLAMNQSASPGSHSFTIPAGTLIPGTYFYSLQVGSAVLKKRLSVVR